MRTDYHFHPNLNERRPAKKLKAIWNAFEEHHLDAVVCAEHAFKDPAFAYRQVVKSKPKHMRTHVFPGAELVTGDGRAGVDVIAFAEHDWYDEHPRLLEPFTMNLKEMIGYLEASNLHWFIAHPTIMRTPLLSLYPTQEAMQEFLATVPAFEARNGTHLLIEYHCTNPFIRPFLRRVRDHLRASAEPTLDLYYKDGVHRFLAVGSDAHSPKDVGYSVEIPGKAQSRRHALELMTSNTNIQTIYLPNFNHSVRRLFHLGMTGLHESQMRRAGFRRSDAEESALVTAEEGA